MADQNPASSAGTQTEKIEELLYSPVSRNLCGLKSCNYGIDRVTSDNKENTDYKSVRIVSTSEVYEESHFMVSRNTVELEYDDEYPAQRKILITDPTHGKTHLNICREPSSYFSTLYNVCYDQSFHYPVARRLQGDVNDRTIVTYFIMGAHGNGDAKMHYITYTSEKSVFTVHRQRGNGYEFWFKSDRNVAKQNDGHSKAVRATGNEMDFPYKSERKLRGLIPDYFHARRDIIGVVERSIYVPFLRYIEPEQMRTVMRRMIGSGHSTDHYRIRRQRYSRMGDENKAIRSLSVFDNSYWPTVRGIIKTPEEYFGKTCIYKQDVANLVFDMSSADANVALVKDVSSAEYDLDLMETREEVHGKIDNRGHYTSQTDKKIKYYPPLNSLSSVMILPNWNTSSQMTQMCRRLHMIVEACPLSGKKYNLHIRFDEPPTIPLYFTVLVMNPDRTIEGGNPTVTNLLLDTGLTEDDIKKLQDIVSQAS